MHMPSPRTTPAARRVHTLTLRQRLAIILCACLTVTLVLTGGGSAPAEARSLNRVCGTFTCTWYFSKDLTRQMVTPSAITSIVTSLAGGLTGRIVGAASGVVSAKAADAASRRECLRIRFLKFPSYPYRAIIGISSDGSSRCWAR